MTRILRSKIINAVVIGLASIILSVLLLSFIVGAASIFIGDPPSKFKSYPVNNNVEGAAGKLFVFMGDFGDDELRATFVLHINNDHLLSKMEQIYISLDSEFKSSHCKSVNIPLQREETRDGYAVFKSIKNTNIIPTYANSSILPFDKYYIVLAPKILVGDDRRSVERIEPIVTENYVFSSRINKDRTAEILDVIKFGHDYNRNTPFILVEVGRAVWFKCLFFALMSFLLIPLFSLYKKCENISHDDTIALLFSVFSIRIFFVGPTRMPHCFDMYLALIVVLFAIFKIFKILKAALTTQ